MRGERQRVIEQRVYYIDEWHFGDDSLEEIGPHVGYDTHQQSACAESVGDQPIGRRVAGLHKKLRYVDEVVERVFFFFNILPSSYHWRPIS